MCIRKAVGERYNDMLIVAFVQIIKCQLGRLYDENYNEMLPVPFVVFLLNVGSFARLLDQYHFHELFCWRIFLSVTHLLSHSILCYSCHLSCFSVTLYTYEV